MKICSRTLKIWKPIAVSTEQTQMEFDTIPFATTVLANSPALAETPAAPMFPTVVSNSTSKGTGAVDQISDIVVTATRRDPRQGVGRTRPALDMPPVAISPISTD